jgi:O-antigen/teichoic acid export membrane protein
MVIRRSHVVGVGLAGVVSAIVSYLVLVIAAHSLPPTDNAIFLAYWALLFGLFGVVSGLHPESARASQRASMGRGRPTPFIVSAAVGFGAIVCGAIGVTSLVWASHVLDREHAWLAGVVVLAAVALSGHLALTGVFAGQGRWGSLITVNLFESLLRLLCVLVALLWFDSLTGIAVASAVSAAGWLMLLGFRGLRQGVRARSDTPMIPLVSNFGHACIASTSSALLIVGFPVLIRLTADTDEFLGSAGLLLAISLTRAPLLIPLNAYQGVALKHFLARRGLGIRGLYPIVTVVGVVTMLAAILAALWGPALFSLVLGGSYTIDGVTLAGLSVGAGVLCLITFTGVACLAVGRHRAYAVGWVMATLSAVLLLDLSLALETRTVLSLIIAPLCGAGVHIWAIHSSPDRAPLGATVEKERS